MKGFNLIPREYLKLLLELVVVFLSVVLAFFFDDYRENRRMSEQYKSDLNTFKSELGGVIGDINLAIDSFRVSSDPDYGGARFCELIDLLWLDSLVDQRKATMADFRYIIKRYYLDAFRSEFKISPLANEIRIKYSTQAAGGSVLNWLAMYQEEMTNYQKGNSAAIEKIENLSAFIQRTSPNLEFDKQDSLLLYSKEATWAFKKVLTIQKDLYGYAKYLAQQSLIEIGKGLTNELVALDVETTWDPDCYGPDFKKRYRCVKGKSITDEDLIRIKDAIIQDRVEYLSERRK